MRLNRLALTRYGKFTDYLLDFGAATPGRPDLHIVYGANEAGKTTVLCGFLDLLYGIELQSRFNFLHPYQTMRVGACLEHDGEQHHVLRVKRQQNTLLDGQTEQPITERLIGTRLGGIDRDSYRAMFSLDDDTIEKGGESILASKGDLGQLLFAAAAGLSDLSNTLTKLRGEADEFYRPNSRFGELAQLKQEIAKRKDERHRIDLVAAVFKEMTDTRDRALELYRAAYNERTALQARMSEVQARLRALPRLRELRALRERIAPLAHLPDAPAGWIDEAARLQRDEIALSVRLERTVADIARRRAELASLTVDEAILAVADRIDGWADTHGRARAAVADIPLRQREAAAEEAAIAAILHRAGRPEPLDPRAFLLGTATVNALRELIETRSGIEAAVRTAQSELSQAQRDLAAARERLQQAAPDVAAIGEVDLSVLSAAVHAVSGNDDEHRRRTAERSRTGALAELQDWLSQLRPWQGDADQLFVLQPPDEATLRGWQAALAREAARVTRHEEALARLRDEQLPLEAQCAAIAAVSGLVSDGEAAAIRAEREAAWAAHRRSLDTETATVFEAVLRRDDIVTDTRLRHEKELTRLQQMREKLAVLHAQSQRELELLEFARQQLQAAHNAVAAGLAAMTPHLPTDMPIAQVEDWLRKRGRALETRVRLQQIARDLHEAETDSAHARSRLATALTMTGIAHDPAADVPALLAIAQAALAREARLKELRGEIEQRRHGVAARAQAVTAATQAEEQWRGAWSATCAACWLRDLGAAPDLAAVREILEACAALAPALERHDSLLARIAGMQDDRHSFSDEVGAVARVLGLPSPNGDALTLAPALAARLLGARRAQEVRAAKMLELEKIQAEEAELTEARAHHQRRRTVMTDFFDVREIDEVSRKLQEIDRRVAWQGEAARIEREILDDLRITSVAEAEALLDQADRPALETELADLKTRFDEQDQRVQNLYADHQRAHDQVEAVDGDGTVARLEEERKTLLLQIEDGAIRYLRLRTGIAAAEHALRLYRHRHQSSMMAQASKAFRTITRGAYSGLTSQPDRDREVLVAIAADGGSREADKLSKGTRFQLYLALRVAGYHEFARQRHPVPFIADDIMETFDDFRAEEAIRLFAEMGTVGQVIYLTHHRHLCEIARKVCPDVHLHDLSAAAA